MSQRGYVLLRKMARRVKEGKDWTTTSIQQYYTVSRPRQKMSLFSLVVTHVVNRKFKWLGPFLALLYTMSVVVGPLKNKRNRTEPNRTEPNRTEPNPLIGRFFVRFRGRFLGRCLGEISQMVNISKG